MGKKFLGLSLFLLIWTHTSYGSHTLFVGAGAFSYYLNKTTNANDASSSLLGTIRPIVNASADLSIGDSLGLQPGIAWTILPDQPDNSAKNSFFVFSLPVVLRMGETSGFKAGLGLLMNRVSGDGGTVTLNNGASFADFEKPSGSSTSKVFFLGVGFEFGLFGPVRFDVDLVVPGILSNRRSLGVLGSLNIGVL